MDNLGANIILLNPFQKVESSSALKTMQPFFFTSPPKLLISKFNSTLFYFQISIFYPSTTSIWKGLNVFFEILNKSYSSKNKNKKLGEGLSRPLSLTICILLDLLMRMSYTFNDTIFQPSHFSTF